MPASNPNKEPPRSKVTRMRSTIACERCRRSKVKCKHNGQPPCIGCLKSGTVEACTLSGPVLTRKQPPNSEGRRPKRTRLVRDHENERGRTTPTTTDITDQDNEVAIAFHRIPRQRFIKCLAVFQAQFPEFGFLHPTDLDYVEADINTVQMLRLLATLSVSSRYIDGASTASCQQHASLVTNELHKRITSAPGLCLIQTFLVLSLYDWGEGEGFNAWMHAGIASRMAQGLLSVGLPGSEKRSLSEVEKRTVWACFVMDKLLSCGKRRQAMFNLENMELSLPLNDAEFAFGPGSAIVPLSYHDAVTSAQQVPYGTGDFFLVTIRGLHIWSKVHTWKAEGGRKQPRMTEPEHCPWRDTSDWAVMKKELMAWRESQDPKLRYPETKAAVHVHLRQAEKFGYINLIYYVSLMFLCREYIPFAPVGETKPRGPIERPLLKDVGPDIFWSQNLVELFYAATQISNILKDLRLAGSPIHTPFTGLCAFSSALMGRYAAAFPAFMGFSDSEVEAAERQAAETSADLASVGRVWKIANEWIDVLDTAQSLFSRLASNIHIKRSRYDYPELEESINLAPLKGIPRPISTPPRSSSQQEEARIEPGVIEHHIENSRRNDLDPSLAGPMTLDWVPNDSEQQGIMDDESWRLWSFWDDPHLLSTAGEPQIAQIIEKMWSAAVKLSLLKAYIYIIMLVGSSTSSSEAQSNGVIKSLAQPSPPPAEPCLLHRSLLQQPDSVVSAYGIYLTLSSGRHIMDGCAGAAVSVIGHGNRQVQAAIIDQVTKVSYVHTGAYTTDSAESLANFLLEGKPFGLSKAYIVGSGSEAVDSAMKLARQYHVENGQPQRRMFVARRRAYHGNTIGAMSVSSNIARKAPYEGALMLENVRFVSPAYAYRGQLDSETEQDYAARLVQELDAEFQAVGPDTIVAFIAETVGGATAGCITAPKGYFEGVRRVCDKYGILLILDEVMCGSGRVGTYFAFEQEGNVRPDIVTVGKGIGGGYAPIAGALIHERIVETLRRGTASFVHGHTYQAHPVSCAAALAVQKVIRTQQLVARCAALGQVLEMLLKAAFGDVKYVGDIRGRGLFWALEFVEDRATKRPFPKEVMFGPRVQEVAMDLGLAVYPGVGTADGLVGDHVLLAPPLTVKEEELHRVVQLLKDAYDIVEGSIV
ncbi:hypothetical protein G7046_g2954 [Stylonectria norvegica]|nr:hypothetical protein G7046_g2954 [Stylonectria norvegica]